MLILATFLLAFLPIGTPRLVHHAESSSEIYTHYCAPEGSCYPVWSSIRNCSSTRHFNVFPLLQVIPDSVKEQYSAVLQRYQISFEVKFFDDCFIRAVSQHISKIEGRPIDSSQVYVLPLKDLQLVWANAEPGIDSIWLPTSLKPQAILSRSVTFSIFARSATASEELVTEINETAGFLEETFEVQYKEGKTYKSARLQMHTKRNMKCEASEVKSPKPINNKLLHKMILIGGYGSSTTESYLPNDTSENKKLADLNVGRRGLVGALFNGKIYVAGGLHDETTKGDIQVNVKHEVTTEVYDVNTKQWQMGQNMTTTHTYGSACVFNDRLVVCGGLNYTRTGNISYSYGYTSRCEFLKSNGTVWEVMKPMLLILAHHSCAVVNNKLSLIGGRSPNKEIRLSQIYNPVSDKWSFGARSTKPRIDAASAVIDNKIFTCGGRPSIFRLDFHFDCEVYDNIWTLTSGRMIKPRRSFVLLPFKGELYAFGGMNNDHEKMHEVEIYNPKNDTWRLSDTSMIFGRSYFIGVVVE